MFNNILIHISKILDHYNDIENHLDLNLKNNSNLYFHIKKIRYITKFHIIFFDYFKKNNIIQISFIL